MGMSLCKIELRGKSKLNLFFSKFMLYATSLSNDDHESFYELCLSMNVINGKNINSCLQFKPFTEYIGFKLTLFPVFLLLCNSKYIFSL